MKQPMLGSPSAARALAAASLVNSILLAGLASAQTATNAPAAKAPVKLPTVVVTGESQADATVQPAFLPAVEGARIYSGKKTTVIDFDALPLIQSDNYRQAFTKTPGLLVSEMPNPAFLNLGSRGVGDPHESQDLMVLRDGIPFAMDLIGYPTVYYAPPLTSVDRLEFVRGGAALLFGPQPAGALNYVTHQPRRDRAFAARVDQVFGSDSLYSTYASVEGTSGRVGYLGYLDHRQGDSFRDVNSDYRVTGGTIKLVLDADRETRWTLGLDAFNGDSGEPGGLTFGTVAPAGGAVFNYAANRNATQHAFDRVRVERYAPSLTLEHDFSPATRAEARVWGGYSRRFSRRETDTGFGTQAAVPVADADGNRDNLLTLHEYYFSGTDARARHDWTAWENDHTLTAGFTTYYSDAPFSVRRGETPTAEDGALRQQSRRGTAYGAVFAENKFTFAKFSVVPAVRLETIHQHITELVNDGTGEAVTPKAALSRDSYVEVVPLLALGLAYDLGRGHEAYANVSEGYKAKTFTDAVPLGTADTVSANLDPAHSWTYELGLRGAPQPWLTYDASVFLIDYDNRFGRVGANIQNVGRSINQGLDLALEVDLLGLYDSRTGGQPGERDLAFNLHGNVEFLDARFESGPLTGLTPQYAPDHLVRVGATLHSKRWGRVGLMGTFVDDHWANDNNGLFAAANPDSSGFIPAYMVWDLTAEVRLYKETVSLLAGVNNLLDEDYFSRVRADGIQPAYGRNYYVGLSVKF
jgi:Fe(3+) dicitrate transport protein